MATPSKSKSSPRVAFEVTQEIIEAAKPRDSSHCMIADALQDAVPNAKYISVDLATIRFTDLQAGKRYIYLTPRVAQEALLKFDQGETVEPFTLRISGAHVLPTGSARHARASLEPNPRGDKNLPERHGGQSPPLGPLPGGAPSRRRKRSANEGGGAGNRTGRRREYGLRAIIR